jgi:predicted RNA-binding protein YlxR (DUF448 family)
VGCGESAPKDRLVRFVLRGEALEPDPAGTLAGRGAYLHRNPACAREAIRRRGFDRSFRTQVTAPGDRVLESVS